MKIITKLIMGFIVMVLLVGLISYFSLNATKDTVFHTIGTDSVLLAEETMDKIDRVIFYRLEQTRAYSLDVVHENLFLESNLEFDEMENREEFIAQVDEDWSSGKETDFIQEILNNELSNEIKEEFQLNEFYEEQYGYSIYSEVFVTNKYGVVIASTGRTTDYYQADEEWYQNAINNGSFWIGNINYDKSADVHSLDIVVVLYNENNDFTGVFKAVLNVEEFIDMIKAMHGDLGAESHLMHGHSSHQTMDLELLTHDARIIYSTDIPKFLVVHESEMTDHLLADEEFDKNYFIINGDSPGEGEELTAHSHSSGYRDYKGMGWIFVVEHETSEIFEPYYLLRNKVVSISLILIILGILFGILFSFSITKPLKELGSAAEDFSKGNLKTKADVKTKDEIGSLATIFNQMINKIALAQKKEKQYAIKLEKKVKEKTKDLRKRLDELKKFQKLTVGRELRMFQLKKELKELKKQLGKKKKTRKK